MQEDLLFEVHPPTNSCFTINGVRDYDPQNLVPGKLTFNVTNAASHWIDLVVEQYYPTSHRIWQTWEIQHDQSDSFTTDLQNYPGGSASGAGIHIMRWAPGWMGLPGSGGGDVNFSLPKTGNVTINITVTS